jgi:ABC-type branched-subunit amino acid transport system ATPase component/ABC-type branched-subunit amino acid transport system permease subunit
MTTAARDLYLLVAVIGLAPAVAEAGMPFLAQSAFVALGGMGTLQLERAGLPIGAAGLLSIVGGAIGGYAVGLLVARADTAHTALATWGLAWVVYTALVAFPVLSGGDEGLTRPAPDHVETVLGRLTLTSGVHAAVALALCALALWGTARLRAGPAGLDLAAAREDPELAAALGTPLARRRAAALAVSGACGAAAGGGIAVLLGVAAPADVSPLLALQLFAAAIVGGRSPWLGPLLGFAVIWAITPLADALSGPLGVASTGLVTAALLVAAIALRPLTQRLAPRAAPPGSPPATAPPPPPASPATLTARDVAVSLGGQEILRGVGLDVRGGEVHALIGPNGSGKTTLLRILAGALAPDRGTVALDGRDLTAGGQRARVRAGVVRTFQELAGFAGLVPYRQMRLAVQGGAPAPGAALADFAGLPAAVERETAQDGRAWAALELAELTGAAHAEPATLSTGARRLVQLACAAATGARVLALDEPAAGMGPGERETLLRTLRRLAESGRAVLVVEHDLRLVARAADRVTVLDDGRVIARGTPAEVIADPAVRRAYLGTD